MKKEFPKKNYYYYIKGRKFPCKFTYTLSNGDYYFNSKAKYVVVPPAELKEKISPIPIEDVTEELLTELGFEKELGEDKNEVFVYRKGYKGKPIFFNPTDKRAKTGNLYRKKPLETLEELQDLIEDKKSKK